MANDFYEPSSSMSRRRAVECQDFTAVVLVGYGEKLHPFNEGTNVLSKALLPVGNSPIINTVLTWVLEAGIKEILIIVPPVFYGPISDHLAENFSSAIHPRARLNLKKHTDGEKEEEENDSSGIRDAFTEREGTARLLRRFKNQIRSDFILLPCDISLPPSLTLASILDKHRSRPEAVLTSVFYEPVEAAQEGEGKLLVALDKATEELLLIQPLEGIEDELDMRMSLITSHPSLFLSTRLVDAHIYVFRRTILDLMWQRRSKDLDSMREQVVPWLVKGGWQKGLQDAWAPILNPQRRDPLAEALARSTTAQYPSSHSFNLPTPRTSPNRNGSSPLPQTVPATPSPDDDRLPKLTGANLGLSNRIMNQRRPPWCCQVIVAAPKPVEPEPSKPSKGKPPIAAEPEHIIRANSLAGYWELNRRFMRSLTANMAFASSRASAPPSFDDPNTAQSPISSSAQISPDSLLGESTRVGDRASIKKCVIGRHCNIGRGAKLTGCILWDFVTVEENARIENAILCTNVRIGEKAQIKDCEFGTGFEAKPGAILKGEKLVVGKEA